MRKKLLVYVSNSFNGCYVQPFEEIVSLKNREVFHSA